MSGLLIDNYTPKTNLLAKVKGFQPEGPFPFLSLPFG